MEQGFDFLKLLPNLQWEIMLKMNDNDLVNLCRASHEMERFCNTLDWFWKQRIEAKFFDNNFENGFDNSFDNQTIQEILKNKGSWFLTYFVLLQLSKLRTKLKNYSLQDIYNLKRLYLRDNQLTELPPQIGQLVNLQSLVLGDNQLTELPPQIKQLTNLQSLVLGHNKLTKLPSEIGKLTNLRYLDLEDNLLKEIPPEIKQLKEDKTTKIWF